MDLNSRLFDSIRIKPASDEPSAAEGPVCEHPGCRAPGLHRAPRGRGQEGKYFRFCLDHVRAYNASYNYFAGMSDDAVVAYQKDAVIGHRPTWSMGVNPGARGTGASAARGAGAKSDAARRDWEYLDPLGILRAEGMAGGEGAPRRAAKPEPAKPRLSGTARRALDVLGLEEGATAAEIKAQYKSLVKRFHPDANGGDRSFEERLRDIIKAHDALRAAGLC